MKPIPPKESRAFFYDKESSTHAASMEASKRVAIDHKGQAIVVAISNKSAEFTDYDDFAIDQIL